MQFLDLITALTLAGILAILLVYVMVVYKKGWLKRDSNASENYFLCPNSKCRRVFRDPIWLTDLSKTPPESYQACPHCSMSLQISPSFSATESLESKTTPAASPPIKDFKKPSARAPHIQRESVSEKKRVVREVVAPAFQTNISKSSEKPIAQQQPKKSAPTLSVPEEAPSKPGETPKKHHEKDVSERPRACSHYFGYVKTLPKNTSIPDECLWCPWIVKCLTGAEKIEA